MFHASSALRTWAASRSSSEYTAMVRSPISLAPRITLTAISPRLATRTESMAGILERDVPVLLGRKRHSLGPQHVEGLDQALARLPRLDDLIDEPPFCRDIRIGERLLVVVDQLGASRLGIVGIGDLAAVDDVDRALGTHHRDLGGRPGEGHVGADAAGVHDDIGAAVRLASDDGDAGYGRFAVGVQQLGAVADDPAVFLVHAGEESGHVDEP